MNLINKLVDIAKKSYTIDSEHFKKNDVKRGLRNKDGSGVLAGLTNIGRANGTTEDIKPAEGELIYRGIQIKELAEGLQKDKRPGFDETVFLLLFGKLPNKDELKTFSKILAKHRSLPEYFTENMILTLRGKNVMNILARSVLALYSLDEKADDTSLENMLTQCINIIAKFPTIIAYSYRALSYDYKNKNLIIRHPLENLSTAENFLYMLKKDYTELDAEILDLCLVLHAEHGGGNNSSFTAHVVSSSGTDTYSVIAAALGSLKGPLHGGANLKTMQMLEDIMKNVKNWSSEDEVMKYLLKIMQKKAFDGSGKLFGFGHAVYTKSDPRAIILKDKAKELAKNKDRLKEYELYALVEKLAPIAFKKHKNIDKVISANVDFYSGFVYDCLEIPKEVYTPLFAMARIAGWSAHRIEEVVSSKRIIRPAYKSVCKDGSYVPFSKRT